MKVSPLFLTLFVFAIDRSTAARAPIWIAGCVVDSASDVGLGTALISVRPARSFGYTDSIGFFKFRIPNASAPDSFTIDEIGYGRRTVHLHPRDTILNLGVISLVPTAKRYSITSHGDTIDLVAQRARYIASRAHLAGACARRLKTIGAQAP